MSTFDERGNASAGSDLFDVSVIADLSDDELQGRRRQIAEIEREEFHRDLSPARFLAHEALVMDNNVAHLRNEPLDKARRAVDEEIRRRRLW